MFITSLFLEFFAYGFALKTGIVYGIGLKYGEYSRENVTIPEDITGQIQ